MKQGSVKSPYRKKRPRRAKFQKKQKAQPSSLVRAPRAYRKKGGVTYQRPQKTIYTKSDLIDLFAPHNLRYILRTKDSPFNLKRLKEDEDAKTEGGIVAIPEVFSIIDNPTESIAALKRVVRALVVSNDRRVVFDYEKCKSVDIGTQALMDVILMEYNKFGKKCSNLKRPSELGLFPEGFGGRNITDENLKKMMFSVGSPACLGIRTNDYPDIIPFKMCSRRILTKDDRSKLNELKDLDTTEAVDYVINCLAKMNKRITPKKLNDLSTVFGEILINAEEHSTLNHRFSVGYFQETTERGKHYGLLKLVILNFGNTIYETFKNNPKCPLETVEKMRSLSENYTRKGLFKTREFEEETLWTLYALQQGVTSVAGKRRGSGTIQFIRSFFNIKGDQKVDNISRMVLHSGRTQVIFDGTYGIKEKVDGNNKFNMMTFNDSGSIEDMPDKNYVKTTGIYFPGTIITANILLNDDDIKEIS